MKSKKPLFILWLIFCGLRLPGAGGEEFAFAPSVQGQRAAAYFAAFNAGGEEAMTDFLKENLSAAALQRASLEERLARFRGFRSEVGKLVPARALGSAAAAARYLVRGGNGEMLEFTFQFAGGAEARIDAILGAPVDPETAGELSGAPLSREDALARVRMLLDEAAAADAFSGVVLVAQDDQVALHEARGLASIEHGAPNRPDTRFNLGSINKLFTRVAVGQLAEAGKLRLDDTIGKFLPDYPNREAAAKVTVRQLLDMTSGIGDFFGRRYAETPKDRIRALEDYLPLFAAEPLLFTPGSQRRYSNGGYVVLGLIVARASGQEYFDYVRGHVYGPAGMAAAAHLEADAPEKNVASGYTRDWGGAERADGPRRSNVYSRPGRGSSAGGGYATAMDLFRFARALRAGKLLGDLGREWFSGPQAYAGGAPGINAELEIDPVPGWTVVVMGNYDPPAASSLAQRIGAVLKRLH